MVRDLKLTIQVSESESHVCLREAQSDALVFELFSKLLQVFCGQILLKGILKANQSSYT